MIKFLHLADVHLGLKLDKVAYNSELAEERRRALWESFQGAVAYAVKRDYDFLFIAGDLYEEDYFSLGDIKRVRDILAAASGLEILIAAGNHDYLHKGSRYKQIEWPENVHIFSSEKLEKKEFKDLDTTVFGYSWDRMEIKESKRPESLNLETDLKNKIMIIHGDVSSNSNYLPLKLENLRDLNMDYIALGHIHKPEFLDRNIAYPGCLEPTNFSETGDRGFIVGELDEKLEAEFIAGAKKKFISKKIKIDENMSYMDIVNLFLKELSRQKDFYRIELSGYLQNDIEKEDLFEEIKSNYYYLEIIDKTSPDYDLPGLENYHKEGIVGEYIRAMKRLDLDEDLVKDALYYGLDSLLKEGMNR